MTCRYIVGDVLEVLRSMPDASVDLVLSSPPFLAVRSYLPADHPDKGKEMGSEATPGAFIDSLLEVVEECRRVLAPHGSLCFELGDTYAGSGGAGGDYAVDGLRAGHPKFDGSASRTRVDGNGKVFRGGERQRDKRGGRLARPADQRGNPDGMRDTTFSGANTLTGGGDGWPLDKSLALIPELLRLSLAYGFNPLTGRQTERWRVRNVVRWCRPNPPVGALGDKVRPATSDILVACVDRKRYFDLDAVRGPGSTNTHARTAKGVESRPSSGKSADDERRGGNFSTLATLHDTNGAPPLDHWWFDEVDDLFPQDAWHVSTEPYKGSHYATWPTDLCVRPILAMCPAKVCTTCGKPSERITAAAEGYADKLGTSWADKADGREKAAAGARTHHAGQPVGSPHIKSAEYVTTGWTDCGHGTYRQGVVLDPFAGSGTTLLVATGHGRSAVGIDLDARNADLARDRVGMWLAVETHIPA